MKNKQNHKFGGYNDSICSAEDTENALILIVDSPIQFWILDLGRSCHSSLSKKLFQKPWWLKWMEMSVYVTPKEKKKTGRGAKSTEGQKCHFAPPTLQKKKRVREKFERSQPWSLTDHRRNPPSEETCTRIERLVRPTLRQDPRTFREVRFWTTFLRSELSLCESILKCWNIHLGTTLRTICEEVWPRPQPEGGDPRIVRERWANFRCS